MNLSQATAGLILTIASSASSASSASVTSTSGTIDDDRAVAAKRSLAGMRALRQLARLRSNKEENEERGLQFLQAFGGFGAGAASGDGCGDSCADQDVCSAYTSLATPVDLKASCDAGCVPEFVLSTCEQFCGDVSAGTNAGVGTGAGAGAGTNIDADTGSTDASADAAILAEQRSGLFGGSSSGLMDLACANCKFYECCIGDDDQAMLGVTTNSKYGACEDHLPTLDALMGGMGGGWDDLMEGLPDLGDILGDMPDLGDILGDLPDLGSTFTDTEWTSMSGPYSDSGLSVLGEMFNETDCPETCTDTDLCKSFHLSMGDHSVVEKACNAGCLPAVDSCDEICGNGDQSDLMGSLADMACDSCKFVECCAESDFKTCQDYLPDMGGLVSEIDWDSIHQEMSEAFENFTDIFQDISEVFANITGQLSSLIEEVVFDVSIPEFCPEGDGAVTCPVEGFCDIFSEDNMNFDLTTLDYEQACRDNAFFLCAPEEFKDICTEQCDGAETAVAVERLSLLDANVALCSLCSIATCCRDKGDAMSFQDCAMGSVPQEIADAVDSTASGVESEDFDGSASAPVDAGEVTPVEASPTEPESSVEAEEGTELPPSEPESELIADEAESPNASPSGSDPNEGAAESLVDEASVDSDSEPLDNPILPAESTVQISKVSALESGSYVSGVSICIAFASIANMFLVST